MSLHLQKSALIQPIVGWIQQIENSCKFTEYSKCQVSKLSILKVQSSPYPPPVHRKGGGEACCLVEEKRKTLPEGTRGYIRLVVGNKRRTSSEPKAIQSSQIRKLRDVEYRDLCDADRCSSSPYITPKKAHIFVFKLSASWIIS